MTTVGLDSLSDKLFDAIEMGLPLAQQAALYVKVARQFFDSFMTDLDKGKLYPALSALEQSIEIYLKALLCLSGIKDKKELKAHGHNLLSLLNATAKIHPELNQILHDESAKFMLTTLGEKYLDIRYAEACIMFKGISKEFETAYGDNLQKLISSNNLKDIYTIMYPEFRIKVKFIHKILEELIVQEMNHTPLEKC